MLSIENFGTNIEIISNTKKFRGKVVNKPFYDPNKNIPSKNFSL